MARRKTAKPSRGSIAPNRLAEIRLQRGLKLRHVAEAVGVSIPTVQRREKGIGGHLKVHELKRYADALGVQPEELLPPRVVPLVGNVGAGAQIYPIDDHAKGGGIDEVSCPPNLDPTETIAVRVVGDSMFPMTDGWLLFCSSKHSKAPVDLIGQLCVVKVANDGPTLVKQLRRGPDRGRYNLVSANAPLLENVELEWAVRVASALPPDLPNADDTAT